MRSGAHTKAQRFSRTPSGLTLRFSGGAQRRPLQPVVRRRRNRLVVGGWVTRRATRDGLCRSPICSRVQYL